MTAVMRSGVAVSGRSAVSFGAKSGQRAALVTGDMRGMSRHAAARPDDGGGGLRCRSWCHGLLRRVRRDRADEDQPPVMTVRTDAWLDRWHWRCARRLE